MIFSAPPEKPVYVSRTDVHDPLSACSKYGFDLDGGHWPSVEHYYQGMKFEEPALREAVRTSGHPLDARKLAKKNKRRVRRDWKAVRKTVMTRGVYIKCRAHQEAADALLATGEDRIVETSQYDYYWGCGRDLRGENTFGVVLMEVRGKLRETLA